MKTFEELLAEASQIADKRNKVYNELIKRTTEVSIPALCEVMKGFGVEKLYFSLNTCPSKEHDLAVNFNEEDYYGLAIHQDGDIREARYEYDYRKEGGSWKLCSGTSWQDEDNYNLTKIGIIELSTAIKTKIERMNNKYSKLNEKVEEILSSK